MISPRIKRTVPFCALLAGLVVIGGVRFAGAADSATPTMIVPVEPYRILDTRSAIGIDSTTAVGPGSTITVQITGVGPVPADAVGVVLNLTGTQTTEATYITAWPAGSIQPTTSVLNLTPGIDAPNNVTALLGDGGRLSLFNFTGSTHLVADVAAYLIAGAGGPAGPPGPPGPAGPSGISGREVVESVGEFGPTDPPARKTIVATCPAGKVVVGGGLGGATLYGVYVMHSYPSSSTAWSVTIGTSTSIGGTAFYTVYAICVNAT
jgi:hypothetical protein